MANIAECPFCGRPGTRTKEHVWAQWLHETTAGRELLKDSHGERFQNVRTVMSQGADGRYRSTTSTTGYVNVELPNVTVPVCAACNSQWMSGLESKAQDILTPVIIENRQTILQAKDLEILATWATKSWMAYALTFERDQENPFTVEEYRSMAAAPGPLPRSRIWIFHSHSARAQVAMAIYPHLMSATETAPAMTAPNNAGFAYLATSGVAMFMVLAAPPCPPEGADVLTPEVLSSSAVRECWPNPRPHYFPPRAPLPNPAFNKLLDWPDVYLRAVGLPADGLNHDEIEEALRRFQNGESPAALRDEYFTR